MAATAADVLEVRHYDDHVSRYEQVTYCAWTGGVTVYRAGVEIARHDDVLNTQALKRARVDIELECALITAVRRARLQSRSTRSESTSPSPMAPGTTWNAIAPSP